VSQVSKTAAHAAALASAGLVINCAVVHSSAAQIAALPQPEYSLKDENGVDLLSFNVYLVVMDLSIGSKQHPLTHTVFSGPDGAWIVQEGVPGGGTAPAFLASDSFNNGFIQWPGGVTRETCNPNGTLPYITVVFGNGSETFQGCLTYATVDPTGNSLTYNSNGTYNYTKRDGTIIVFKGASYNSSIGPTQIIDPDGRVLSYWYYNDGSGAPWLKSLTRSDGLQLKYTYTAISGAWSLTSVTAINNAYEYCNPTANTCSLNMTWPTANYSFSASGAGFIVTFTDAAGRVTRYTTDGGGGSGLNGRTVGIKLPSSASADNISYAYCDSNCSQYAFEGVWGVLYQNYVLRVVRDGQTWTYSGNPGSPTYYQCGTATYGFTNPVGSGKQVSLYNCPENTAVSPLPGFTPLKTLTDEDGVQFNPGGHGDGLIRNAIKPEGNQTQYVWDGRGNITQETRVPKSGSPLAQATLSANYPCNSTPVTCNEPTWLKDGLLNETDYTYDPTHGGVLTATLPADANGIRPQTRYTYTQRYAWVLNASGAYVKSAAPIWVLATESYCRTSAATSSGCTVASDQVVKTYEYGPDSGPNNLFPRGVAVTADGVTHRTCYGYDRYGNKISETEAAAGLTSCP